MSTQPKQQPVRTTLDFIPTDTLFCRDQRPLSAGSGYGHGANWPLPTVLHSALRTALLAQAGHDLSKKERSSNNATQRKDKDGEDTKYKIGTNLFNWLNIQGPFPAKENEVYFPRPLDLVPSKKDERTTVAKLLHIVPQQGESNLPAPLTHVVANCETPSKESLENWISAKTFQQYLEGKDGFEIEKLHLWDTEHRIGVALSDETETALDGKLYAAEHLRLRHGISLRFSCSHPPTHKNGNTAEDGLTAEGLKASTLHLGGEQRFGKLDQAETLTLPQIEITGTCIKWVLLTPAIFKHGWLPGWIGEKGEVLLKTVDKSQRATFRRNRREGSQPHDAGQIPIAATLVAACIGKPQIIGGWDLLGQSSTGVPPVSSGSPKATQLAVPSGSTYYFQAHSPEHAKWLAGVLQGRCRSDFYGEKGLGLGVCGTWKPEKTEGSK